MEKTDFTTDVFGSKEMLQPSPADRIPQHGTRPDIAYQMVKDETFAQTQPRLNLATQSGEEATQVVAFSLIAAIHNNQLSAMGADDIAVADVVSL